jgi:hypothetical protein
VKIEMHLTDGRVLPLSAETIDGILAQIAAHGVTPDLVEATIHIIDVPWPSITCPTCGAKSYNKHDIAEKYCSACKQFHEFLP